MKVDRRTDVGHHELESVADFDRNLFRFEQFDRVFGDNDCIRLLEIVSILILNQHFVSRRVCQILPAMRESSRGDELRETCEIYMILI